MNEYDKLLEEKGTLPPTSLVPDLVRAPWNETQVRNLNARQQDEHRHPYTCGTKDKHSLLLQGNKDTTLVAKADGWHCPNCDYTQDWAHSSDTLTSLQQVDAFIAKGGIILTDEEKAVIDKLLD